jgi:hypothetical protein
VKELTIVLTEWNGNIDRQRMYLDKETGSVCIEHEYVRPDGSVGIYQDEGSDIAVQDLDKVINFLQEMKKEASK